MEKAFVTQQEKTTKSVMEKAVNKACKERKERKEKYKTEEQKQELMDFLFSKGE